MSYVQKLLGTDVTCVNTKTISTLLLRGVEQRIPRDKYKPGAWGLPAKGVYTREVEWEIKDGIPFYYNRGLVYCWAT
jgi:hypothetical protein